MNSRFVLAPGSSGTASCHKKIEAVLGAGDTGTRARALLAFIWIASSKSLDLGFGTGFFPDWDRKNNLLAILLHEVGHLYGSDHVSGTIMTSEISNVLSSGDSLATTKENIDHAREFYRCDHCAYDLTTTISIDDKRTGWKMVKSLIGRVPEDFAKVRITRAESSGILTVQISDGNGTSSFQFILSSTVPVDNDVKIFQSPYGLSHKNYSSVSNGTTLAVSGKRVALALEYNMGQTVGSSPLVLTALDEGRRVELARFLTPQPDPTN